MTPINEGPSRIAYCECGAQLAGDSEQELFDAAQQHLAHHHPQLLGALELDVVAQMSEERPGAISA
jgi:predicted small metal-binding protein